MKGEYGRMSGWKREMVTTGEWQQHVASFVKGFECGLGTIGLRMLASFWAGIPVDVTREAGVVPRCRRSVIGTHF